MREPKFRILRHGGPGSGSFRSRPSFVLPGPRPPNEITAMRIQVPTRAGLSISKAGLRRRIGERR